MDPGSARSYRRRQRAFRRRRPGRRRFGGVDGEGNPELLSAAGLVKVEDALVVPAQVDVFLLDVRIEIQPLALERVGPADPQGADEIGRVAGSQLGRELGTSAAIGGVI